MAIVINGSGTVTGISVGGLPDGIVDSGTLATNSVDSAELIDGSIDNSHLADDAVDSDEIAAGAIDAAHLASGVGFDPDAAVVFNESGTDVDFRVESNTDAYAFEVNGEGGKAGIGCGATVTGLVGDAWGGEDDVFFFMHSSNDGGDAKAQIGNRAATNSSDESASLHLACSTAGKGVILRCNREGTFDSAANSSSSFEIITNNQNSAVTALSLSKSGALSKASGSFRIDHPLPEKKDTHHLVHSFVESPRADLIYRGKATLVDGSATINIDTAAGMTEGTFVLLCDDVQCFTSNESDWDAVKGSVSENILTIECENSSSTAEIAWMVVADRKDEHIMDTEWTDENGKPIVEPTKP